MRKNIFKVLVLGVLVLGTVNTCFANDVDDDYDYDDEDVIEEITDDEDDDQDLYTGPGASMVLADFDNENGRIYAAGVGPLAGYVDTSYENALEFQSPVSVDYDITNPVDHTLLVNGSRESTTYESTHSTSDGGPGQYVTALSYTEYGPTITVSNADPSNYSSILDITPTSGEGVYRDYKKNASNNTKVSA